MVTLYVKDYDQVTLLETALVGAKINYSLELDEGGYGVRAPYLVVDGVPLDKNRAFAWIGERTNE